MALNLDTVDFDVQRVDEILPTPHLALSGTDHFVGPIGDEGKGLLLELLETTDEDTPAGPRLFDRLGVAYQHARWRDYDVYWVEGGASALVEALREWHLSHITR